MALALSIFGVIASGAISSSPQLRMSAAHLGTSGEILPGPPSALPWYRLGPLAGGEAVHKCVSPRPPLLFTSGCRHPHISLAAKEASLVFTLFIPEV